MSKLKLGILISAFVMFLSLSGVFASEVTEDLGGTIIDPGLSGGTSKSAPVASPAAATYTSDKNVTFSASGSSAICYRTDGTAPACASATTCASGSTKYTGAISVTSTKTIKSVACYGDGSQGPQASHTYTLVCVIASVTNGTVSAYPTCAITCNSGYTKSGNSCVYSGGGGASGGYTPVSTPTPTPSPTLIPAPTVPTAPVTIPALPSNPTAVDVSNVLTAAMRQVLYIQANISASNALTLLLDVTQRLAQLRTALGQAVPAGSLTANLSPGSRGDNVTALQNFLKAQGPEIFPEGLITGYFGPFTRKAVERFQVKYGIAKEGDAGYGFVGPRTRAKINQLQGF